MYRTHTCGDLRAADIDKEITLAGWVCNRRDHGGIIFIDLRDKYGLTQVVFDPEHNKEAWTIADSCRSEYVVQITGKVRSRPEGQANSNLDTGEVEVISDKIQILSSAKTPPFEITDRIDVREDLRLEYRYLDLRRDKMQKNLKLRHDMVRTIRDYHDSHDFMEVETPMMVKGTPEGSGEYIIPSRLHPADFYVLPQSPQQLKQLLVVGGVDKYFQVARCFRDEDLRGDRQPEFTQYEIEMAFVQDDDVMEVVEGGFHKLNEEHAKDKEWKSYLTDGKFVRMTWQEAMSLYGSDKPDIRFGMKLVDLTDIKDGSGFGIFERVGNLFALKSEKVSGELSRKDIDELTKLAQEHGAGGLAWLRIGEESGPVAKNTTPEFQASVKEQMQASDGDLVFFGAGDFTTAVEPLGAVRLSLGDKFEMRNPDHFAYLWVVDFPMFEKKEDGSLQAAHHPFTMPHEADLDKLLTDQMSVRSHAYDIVLNGVELGGGSIRIHDQEIQHKVFEALGMNEEEIQSKFGHLLKAFAHGCPPHGGCAMGLDRVVMLFAGEPNIREVMAFPKNGKAQDLMLGAPSHMRPEDLTEVHIKTIDPIS